MKRCPIARVFVVVVCVTGLSMAHRLTASQAPASWDAPMTPDGQPDIQGIWSFATVTPLERPDALAGKEFLTEEEAAAFEQQVRWDVDSREGAVGTQGDVDRAYNQFWWDRGTDVIGTRRTSLIVGPRDGKIPQRTPEGQVRFETYGGFTGRGGTDSWEDRSLWERCITNRALPRLETGYNNHLQIYQTADHVAILYEMIHEVRIVPLGDTPHLPSSIRQFLGDSRGRWEGNTLVVDVTNFTDKTNFQGAADGLHLTERFTRTGPNTLTYEFAIDDRSTFTRSWRGELPMPGVEGPIYEYACHEGNRGLPGILAGERALERANDVGGAR